MQLFGMQYRLNSIDQQLGFVLILLVWQVGRADSGCCARELLEEDGMAALWSDAWARVEFWAKVSCTCACVAAYMSVFSSKDWSLWVCGELCTHLCTVIVNDLQVWSLFAVTEPLLVGYSSWVCILLCNKVKQNMTYWLAVVRTDIFIFKLKVCTNVAINELLSLNVGNTSRFHCCGWWYLLFTCVAWVCKYRCICVDLKEYLNFKCLRWWYAWLMVLLLVVSSALGRNILCIVISHRSLCILELIMLWCRVTYSCMHL